MSLFGFPPTYIFKNYLQENWFICSLGVKTKQAKNLRDDIGDGPFGGYLLRNQLARSGERGQLHAVESAHLNLELEPIFT